MALLKLHQSDPLTTRLAIQQAVAVVDNKHKELVQERATTKLGKKRAPTLGPVDLSRNALRSGVARLNRSMETAPLVQGLPAGLPFGQPSLARLVQRYALMGGTPASPAVTRAVHTCLRYWLAAGFSSVRLGWSEKDRAVTFETISPDKLEVEFNGDQPNEPMIIRYIRQRWVAGQWTRTVEHYDLTDEDAPKFRIEAADEAEAARLTREALGDDTDWPSAWRYPPTEDGKPGRPYHRIVTIGDPERVWDTLTAVDSTLSASVYWTAWGAGMVDAGYPARNVRGLRLANQSTQNGAMGVDVGPEVVNVWIDEDPQIPGTHWQDAPGFDPEATGRALARYEQAAYNALGLPVGYENVGGDPGEAERQAVDTAIRMTYDQIRGFIGVLMQRAVAMAHAIDPDAVPAPPAQPYAVLLREEVAEEEKRVAEERERQAAVDAADDANDAGDDSPNDDAADNGEPSEVVADVASTALNGAQVQAAQGIVESVAVGNLPRETGIAMLVQFFQIDPEVADDLMGSVGKGFTPASTPDDPSA